MLLGANDVARGCMHTALTDYTVKENEDQGNWWERKREREGGNEKERKNRASTGYPKPLIHAHGDKRSLRVGSRTLVHATPIGIARTLGRPVNITA
jgi:hypothetical protein